MAFGQHSTGEEVVKASIGRTEGKTFVITGPSTGSIGGAAAVALAHGKPKTLFLTGRDLQKVAPVIDEIKRIDANIEAVFVEMDLISLQSVREAASFIKKSGKAEKIHGLINNAGIMATPFGTTKEGVEQQFGVNHLGHFLFTNLLLPSIVAAGPHARIVIVSSTAYGLADVAFDNINFDNGASYHPWKAYGQSKTANILFTVYLSMHLKSKGIKAFTLQPGMPQTGLYKHTKAATDPNDPASFPAAFALMQSRYGDTGGTSEDDLKKDEKTVETASSTPLFALLSPSLDEKVAPENNIFLRNCADFPVQEYAKSPASAEKLWKLSEKLVGEKFEI